MKIIFIGDHRINEVYAPKIREMLLNDGAEDKIYTKEELLASRPDAEYAFSTWGMPHFTVDEIKKALPNLKALFYGAGSVQRFAPEFIECGVKIFSAWAANAVPVAEYTVAQIILSNKGYFSVSGAHSPEERASAAARFKTHRGNFGASVGIIGAGMIGKLVIKLLSPYKLNIKVFDKFLPKETADALGVKLCSLEEIFSSCEVISNHLADNAETRGMLDYSLFSRMKVNSTFINTGRGAQVVEADLSRAMQEDPTRTALLDVTYPEPPAPDHPFYTSKNIILTPHIAGSSGDEVERMGEYMFEEYRALTSGEATRYEVSAEMLKFMA